MTSFTSSGSQDHKCEYRKRGDYYSISWAVDFHYPGSKIRYPRRFERHTGEAAARRFCRKWGIAFPVDKKKQTC
jgi:hypothetical protein